MMHLSVNYKSLVLFSFLTGMYSQSQVAAAVAEVVVFSSTLLDIVHLLSEVLSLSPVSW